MPNEVVKNVYDYSNVIPEIDPIMYIAKYFDSLYNQLLELVAQDEEKNKKLTTEYKNFTYGKAFSASFEIAIRGTDFKTITCKSLAEFDSAVKNGTVKNVDRLKIELNMDFERGKGNNLVKNENEFLVIFEPYKITFTRTSNNSDSDMDAIEANINKIFERFKKMDTIFCTKES